MISFATTESERLREELAAHLVLVVFFLLAPVISTFPVYFLFLLAKTLQAFIFFMLTMIYLKGALEHAH